MNLIPIEINSLMREDNIDAGFLYKTGQPNKTKQKRK